MKKQLFSVLLAVSIFTLNALPVGAFDRLSLAEGNNTVMLRGRWCFKFIELGLLCVDL